MKAVCAGKIRPRGGRGVGNGKYGSSRERLLTRITTEERAAEYLSKFLDGSPKDVDFCLHILERLADEGVNPFSNPLWEAADEKYHLLIDRLLRSHVGVGGYSRRYDAVIRKIEPRKREDMGVLGYEGETFPGEFREAVSCGSGSRAHFNLEEERSLDEF